MSKINKIKSKKTLLVAGNFLDSQLIWKFHIFSAFCKAKGIKNIVVDNELSEISKKYLIKNFNKDFKFHFLKRKNKFREIIRYSFKIIINFYEILSYSLINREVLLKKKIWERYQFEHAVWDSSILNSRDIVINPSTLIKLKNTLICYLAFLRAKELTKKYHIESAFLGHTVYSSRAYILGLRRSNKNIEVIASACDCLYKLDKNKDRSTFIFEKKIWQNLINKQIDFEIKKFKERRVHGISKNIDVSIAAGKFDRKGGKVIENQIFLHVFQDSPFNYIDNQRIFADYIEWISKTIMIIKDSEEEWNIRLHPSSSRWGEDSKIIINSILDKLNLINLPDNIYLSSRKESNIYILNNCKRVLTYSGSVALEASCFGIKPITISETTCNSFDNKLVHKPKTFIEYKNLILKSSSSKLFKQTSQEIETSWQLLFAVEEQISLKTFLNSITLFRSDKKEIREECYLKIKQRLSEEKVLNKLNFLGSNLAKNDIFNTAFEFINN